MKTSKNAITRPVITVAPGTSIAEAARLMLQHRISGLPVVDPKGAVIGIITEGDLLKRAETGSAPRHPLWLELLLGPGRLAEEYSHAHARKVGEAMTSDIVSVAPSADVGDLVQLMNKRRVKEGTGYRRRPNSGYRQPGQSVRALLKALVKKSVRAVNDDEIWKATRRGRIAAQPWGPRFATDINDHGFVDIYGTITDEREGTALRVLAENVPGVKGVRDHLIWAEPVSGTVVTAEGE